MQRYLASLTELLADPEDGLGLGPAVPVMVMEASGGLMTVASAREQPVHTVLSGPAGGVVASAHVALLSGFADIITMDMGGTSTDISLVLDGRPQVTREASLAGTPIRIPVIDINAIGAGGGSIAWIDEGGALRVGPQSAEAVPGPACYGRGGIEPTVTDANLVLGRLGPDTRLGGELALDGEAAARAIAERIAGPLGLDLVAAASGILRVANATMARGIRVVSVERGHDPRRLLEADRLRAERQQIELRVDMRYIGQSYELPIPLAEITDAEWAGLVPAFHAEHLRRFGHNDPASPLEVVSFAVTATGLIDTPELPRPPQGEREPPAQARRGTRRAYFETAGAGWVECPVWQREALLAGNRVAGPAIVEEVSATTVLYPGDVAQVDAIGSLVVEVGERA